MRKTFCTLMMPALLAMVVPGPALAQARDSADVAAVRALALVPSPERAERLLAAAKKEGELSVYHVYPNLTVAIAAFTKKTGLKVKAWRAGSEAVLQRVIAEARGNRFEVDIVQNNSPENEAAHREKLLQEVRSAAHADLVPEAVPAHLEWVGISLDIWTAAYHTGKVAKDELPRSYEDLQDPKWKGRLGIEGNNHLWFGTLLSVLGQEQGSRIFNNIVATNGISARKGHSALTTMVASGDVPLALTVYSWNPEQLKAKGAAIDSLPIAPLIAQTSTIAMLRRAPNPASALLFYEFMLSEGQKILAETQFVPSSKLYPRPFAHLPLKFVDPAKALDLHDAWLRQFDEMIVKKAK